MIRRALRLLSFSISKSVPVVGCRATVPVRRLLIFPPAEALQGAHRQPAWTADPLPSAGERLK
jgi:hypothetical protein